MVLGLAWRWWMSRSVMGVHTHVAAATRRLPPGAPDELGEIRDTRWHSVVR